MGVENHAMKLSSRVGDYNVSCAATEFFKGGRERKSMIVTGPQQEANLVKPAEMARPSLFSKLKVSGISFPGARKERAVAVIEYFVSALLSLSSPFLPSFLSK